VTCPHCGAPNHDGARFCGGCGRATSATEPSRAGNQPAPPGARDLHGREIAGRYRIVSLLGEGGMGAVYRGEQISLKRKCAIKLLKPELSADPGLVRRFNAEAELVAKLSHPNVVNIYDFGQDVDGTLFIAMEYIEGRSLRAAMNSDGPLPARRAVAIAAQVASSLTDAHAHGIVHRDLKPDNVMLTERGREKDVVRVLDFGIAKLRDEGKNTVQQMTQAGDLVGTPQYMAPEQIRGDRVDGRTDVYALGAMLYEMVTGRLPFEGPTVMAILSKHLTETPPSPGARRPELGIPPALDALVMASLAKDPGARVQSMEEVGERLAAIGAQLGGSASQPFVVPVAAAPAVGGGDAWRPGMATHASAGGGAGAMQAPTPQPSMQQPYPPAYGHAPIAAPTGTPPPMHHQAAPVKKGRAGLWIALAVLAAGGIAAGVIVATRGGSAASRGDAPGAGTGTGTGSGSDPWDTSGNASGAVVTRDVDVAAPTDGARYTDTAGWSVLVPPQLSPSPQIENVNGTVVTSWKGKVGDVEAGIAVFAVPTPSAQLDDATLTRGAGELAKNMNAQLVIFDFATIAGERRMRAIYDLGAVRLEGVWYLGQPLSIVAMFGVDRASFDGFEAMRRDFFEHRVFPPGSP
jgi:predicted Ser/Thr protein kinase